MMKVTFTQVQNIECLFNMLSKCVGAIYFKTADGTKIDIRHNHLIKDLLKDACCNRRIEKLSVIVEKSEDENRIVNYLM